MGAVNVYEPLVYTPTSGDFSTGNVLELANDFGREVNVDVYIDGEQVLPDISQTNSLVTLTFNESGSAVIPSGTIKVIVS